MSLDHNSRLMIFPNEDGVPCMGSYALHLARFGEERLVVLHFLQSDPAADLMNDAKCRDRLLNRILETDVKGVAMRHIRLIVRKETVVADKREVVIGEFQIGVQTITMQGGKSVTTTIPLIDSTYCAGEFIASTEHAGSKPLSPEILSLFPQAE